ncbi:GNAT family N-acetyltransferase [Bombilactobacillus thymidiniphilus]|uniref:GNAT family N-acetyltransferase n=1 Tax=Bombilactobacillus thymidiniphilus TaxID=2923363 RepID=A0ABY4PCE5_9LACO|nr:GNAT family N-acetyltransferase [Bombilactobacillus thymidiniphilus]UQS83428.1 GNAT family N-acetyltransferase [Bombilactobacillus thymidiniphilus]
MKDSQLKLLPMTEVEFSAFWQSQIKEYAKQKVANKLWSEKESLQRATDEFTLLLPQGLETYNNFLYTIKLVAGSLCGYLWLTEVVDGDNPARPYLFINDFTILPAYQGQGLSEVALKLAMIQVKKLGYQQVGLHVFGKNTQAMHIYQKAGFKMTDITMIRRI